MVDLRKRTAAMLSRMDLPEVILEVMSWEPGIAAAFTAVSGGRTRLEDLNISIAACLAAHSMNVGYRPIAKKGVPALEWARLSHVFQHYFRPETIGAANAPMVSGRTSIPLAGSWGGGLVAAVDVDETYRRDIKHIRNLQEGRHDYGRRTPPGCPRSCASIWACTGRTRSPCPTSNPAPSASSAILMLPTTRKTDWDDRAAGVTELTADPPV